MEKKTGLIFDMDGTLVKENMYWEVSSAVTLDLIGEKVPFSFIRGQKNNGINSNWEICYNFLKGKTQITYEKTKELFQKKLIELNSKNELIISKESFLEVFSNLEKAFKLFIVTTRPRNEALEAVNNTVLLQFFNERNVFAQEDAPIENSDLKKELLKLVKERTKLNGYFVIGDSVSDIKAAKSLGFKAIGVYESLNNEEFLKKAGADFLIKNISEFPEVFL